MKTQTVRICLIEAWTKLRKGPFTAGMLERNKESLIWDSLPSGAKVVKLEPTETHHVFDVTYELVDIDDDLDEPLGMRTCNLDDDECLSCQ